MLWLVAEIIKYLFIFIWWLIKSAYQCINNHGWWKAIATMLIYTIVCYLAISAVRPDISQNWRDEWRSLLQNAPRIILATPTPQPLILATSQSPTPTPINTQTTDPTEPTTTPTPTSTPHLTPNPPIATPPPAITPTPTSTPNATTTPIPTSATPYPTSTTPAQTLTPTSTTTPTPTLVPTPTSIPTPTPIPTPTATPTPTPNTATEIDARQLEELTHELINAQRVMHGIDPLEHDEAIRLIARTHSQDMAAREYFSHNSPEGFDPTNRALRAGYDCRKDHGSYYTFGLAENIHQGWLFAGYQTVNGRTSPYNLYSPQEIARIAVEGWMNSPGHRQNILDSSYDRAGIGIAIANDGKVFFTQNFC